ncbi:hypothetical protein [Microbacterium sp. 77mftsu3.1]|uniref:hypothetical protein n=1 Tax=Microbacterium sp. 77mftsu3.1 TaxID=1761802 RepID=UPI00036A09D8|nr:hypothetical protein [Microbacterium sp. 77mftsu3.1]SDH40257.1 hypothetical protein SAMN04488590_3249 [Microbacterium sp. 77mftsu3.1]
MTHTAFDETQHIRDTGGRFDRKDQTAPEVALSVPADEKPARERNPANAGASVEDGERVLFVEEYVNSHLKVWKSPVGLTETRRAVKNRRGETDGAWRIVHLDWDSVPPASGGAPLAVEGPKDGRPLRIVVRQGCPDMEILSGNVTIVGGGHGYGITVKEGARVKVVASGEREKFSITAEKGAIVDFYAKEGTRGYQSIEDGAHFRLHGRADGVGLSTDPDFARDWMSA